MIHILSTPGGKRHITLQNERKAKKKSLQELEKAAQDVNQNISEYCSAVLWEQIEGGSSCCWKTIWTYLNLLACAFGRKHICWKRLDTVQRERTGKGLVATCLLGWISRWNHNNPRMAGKESVRSTRRWSWSGGTTFEFAYVRSCTFLLIVSIVVSPSFYRNCSCCWNSMRKLRLAT